VLAAQGAVTESTDERRIMILKAQNGHLTESNAYLHSVIRSQKKVMLEVDNILIELVSFSKSLEQAPRPDLRCAEIL